MYSKTVSHFLYPYLKRVFSESVSAILLRIEIGIGKKQPAFTGTLDARYQCKQLRQRFAHKICFLSNNFLSTVSLLYYGFYLVYLWRRTNSVQQNFNCLKKTVALKQPKNYAENSIFFLVFSY